MVFQIYLNTDQLKTLFLMTKNWASDWELIDTFINIIFEILIYSIFKRKAVDLRKLNSFY